MRNFPPICGEALKWLDGAIDEWSDPRELDRIENKDEAQRKFMMFQWIKSRVIEAVTGKAIEEAILQGSPKRQPEGIAKTVCRDEVKQLLLEQMKTISAISNGLLQSGGYMLDECSTLCSLTERMENLSSEIRAHDQSSQTLLGRIADKSESDMGIGFRVVPEEAGAGMTKSDQTTIRDILDWADRYEDAHRDALEAMDAMERSGEDYSPREYMWTHFKAIFYRLEKTSYKMAANAMRNRDAEWLDELNDIMRRMEAATQVLEGE